MKVLLEHSLSCSSQVASVENNNNTMSSPINCETAKSPHRHTGIDSRHKLFTPTQDSGIVHGNERFCLP